ncbi:hypothetical protein [Cellulomonas sp. C5510]|uniref:hypothetical protein n=1 Tax=Cellulomonas sp. C5510 TaxID=2871170 RepID=UPI001C95A964|nr:hypothetical protein [Cellulomonas sp. C5510]QZN85439.1 hypothetical protein K5O09_17035 [Cellulomonas sp. C5510]
MNPANNAPVPSPALVRRWLGTDAPLVVLRDLPPSTPGHVLAARDGVVAVVAARDGAGAPVSAQRAAAAASLGVAPDGLVPVTGARPAAWLACAGPGSGSVVVPVRSVARAVSAVSVEPVLGGARLVAVCPDAATARATYRWQAVDEEGVRLVARQRVRLWRVAVPPGLGATALTARVRRTLVETPERARVVADSGPAGGWVVGVTGADGVLTPRGVTRHRTREEAERAFDRARDVGAPWQRVRLWQLRGGPGRRAAAHLTGPWRPPRSRVVPLPLLLERPEDVVPLRDTAPGHPACPACWSFDVRRVTGAGFRCGWCWASWHPGVGDALGALAPAAPVTPRWRDGSVEG